MALFGAGRDISLFNNLNKELIKDIIQTEVAYYKFALEQTTSNVYGESMGKVYYEPIKIACLIDREDQVWSSNDFGSDINQNHKFSFLKDQLEGLNLVPEVGDIILFRNNFFEADSKIENQLIMGKDPNYSLSGDTVMNGTGHLGHGASFSIIVNAHISRVEKLNLIPLRGDTYPITNLTWNNPANPM